MSATTPPSGQPQTIRLWADGEIDTTAGDRPEEIVLLESGGKVIRKICEDTGASVDVEDDGTVKVACVDAEMANRAVDIIRSLTEDPEIGRIYRGKVKRIVNFGAFVEILPGRDGLIHISELENRRVAKVEDVVREGDLVLVKVIGIDDEGKVKLSRKAALPAVTGQA